MSDAMYIRWSGSHAPPLSERFWEKVVKIPFHECWEWIGSRARGGYGSSSDEGGAISLAHRVAWRLTHGPIPEGLCVLHRCDNRSCVNPAHLWLGTQVDNIADMVRKGRSRSRRKLSDAEVREIRILTKTNLSDGAVGRQYGVSSHTVRRIRLSIMYRTVS